jgi:hypothetical protein
MYSGRMTGVQGESSSHFSLSPALTDPPPPPPLPRLRALLKFVEPVSDGDAVELIRALFFGRWCNRDSTLNALDPALLNTPAALRAALDNLSSPPWCNETAYPVCVVWVVSAEGVWIMGYHTHQGLCQMSLLIRLFTVRFLYARRHGNYSQVEVVTWQGTPYSR